MPAMPVPADGEARLGAPGPPAAPGSRQGSWPLSYLWLLGTLLRAKNHGNKRFKKKNIFQNRKGGDVFAAQKLISQSLYPGYVANVHADRKSVV